MNSARAAEIAESPVMANVIFGDRPVYIQHVDEANGIARVYALNEPDREMEVPVGQLEEQAREIGFEEAVNACRIAEE